MDTIDEVFLAERERIRAAATEGPWAYDDGVDVCMASPPYQEKNRPAGVFKPSGPTVFTDDDVSDEDATAIVDAVNHQPALIAEIRRLRALVAKRDSGACTHDFQVNYGLTDSIHPYCTKCGIAK